MNKSVKKFLKFFKIHKLLFFKKYFLFLKDFFNFKKKSNQNKKRFSIEWKKRYPCLNDNTKETYFDRHYVYHTGWAARIIAKNNPTYHVDIASSLYFISIASAFVPTKFYDYRPADLKLDNLSSHSADLLNLPFENKSIHSLSCMHVVEHVGLGRYGDPLDPEGDLKAINELQRVVAHKGSLLFVVPIGKPVIMFNAHKIYTPDQIVSYFSELKLKEFSLIPDKEEDGGLIKNPSQQLLNKQIYGCGCFWFVRN
jgi:hypothetical protein